MRTLLAAVGLVLCAACGSGPVILPHDQVDVKAWKADLEDLGYASDRVAILEKLARSDCKESVDDLALRFTLEGAQPEATRLGFKYVCPKRLPRVDKAIAEVGSVKRETETLCSTPREDLSPAKQEKYDAICVG